MLNFGSILLRSAVCLVFLFLSPVHSHCQNIEDQKVTLEIEELKLKKALKAIEREASVRFSYSKKLIPADEKITYHCYEKSLLSVLQELLHPLHIEYQLVDGYIVLRPTGVSEAEVPSASQPTTKKSYTISGYISEAYSGETLIGAAVSVEELGKGTITNPYGFYSLTLPEGSYHIVISYIGYQKVEEYILLGKDQQLNAALVEDTELLPELLIVSDPTVNFLDNIPLGYTEVQPAEIARMPALMGEQDVIRSLQSVPGIKMYADGSTMFHVRGGNRDQNLILLDEAPLYNPSHVLGLFSTVNAEATRDIKLYKSDLPFQHGGRLSSLIDIRTKEGNMKRFGFSGSLGLLSSKLSFEGPLKKDKSSFFVGGRISNFNWFTKNVAQSDAQVGFYDLHTKFNVMLNENNRLFFTFYSGLDRFEDIGNEAIEWGNFAGSIRWNHVFSNKLFLNTTLYSSNYNYYLFTNPQRSAAWHSGIANVSLKSDFSYFINPDNSVYFGLNYRFHHFNPGNYEGSGVRQNVGFVPKKNVNEITLYAGNEQQFYDKLSIRYGLRLNIWQNMGPTTEIRYDNQYQPVEAEEIAAGSIYNIYTRLAPRMALTYNFSEKLSAKIFYNRLVQNIHLISNSISPFTNFEVWLPSAPNIKPQTADHVGAGMFRVWPERGLELSGEVYYKWMDNQIDYKDHARMILNPLLEGELRFGKSRAYGGEVSLRKNLGKWQGWIGYAYSRSWLKIQGVNQNREYPAYFDRPHEVTLNLNYRPNRRWDVGINWIFNSGAAIMTPTGFYQYNGHTVPLYDERGNDRLPDYHRMDLSVNLHLGRKASKFQHYLNFSIYNLYGQKNPVYVNFNKTINAQGEPKVPGDYFPVPQLTPTQTFVYSVVPSLSYNFKL